MTPVSRFNPLASLAAALAALALPGAARAELVLHAKVYGFLNGELEWVRARGGATPYEGRGRVSDGNSRLGVSGSVELGPRTKALWQLEGGLAGFEQGGIDDQARTAVLESRNSFVGVEDERLGRLIVGHHDSAYRSLIGSGGGVGGNLGLTTLGLDLWNNTSAQIGGGPAGLFGRGESRMKNSVHYLSPELFGVRLGGSWSFDEAAALGGRRDRLSLAALYAWQGLKVGVGLDYQGNTGVDADRLLQGYGLRVSALNDSSTYFLQAMASYRFPTGTYVGFGYERSFFGYAQFLPTGPGAVYPSLVTGHMSQGAALASLAQVLFDDLTLMASFGKLGNLSDSVVAPGSDYAATQLSLGARLALGESFATYAYFTRIQNRMQQNVNLGSPVYSNQLGTDGAFLSPGDSPTALGVGLIARF